MNPATQPQEAEKRLFEFRNGENVQFTYGNEQNNGDPSLSSKKKKKKKKKKSGSSSAPQQFSMNDATINDPDADYPESRVIKFDSEGNVVVESLDDEAVLERVHRQTLEAKTPNDFSLFHFNNDEEKQFWADLPHDQKSEIVNVDPHTIMEKFQQQIKQHRSNISGEAKHSDARCSCPYCGRNSRYIEEELEATYREYLDEIVEYIQGVKADTAESMRHLDTNLQNFPQMGSRKLPAAPPPMEPKSNEPPKHLPGLSDEQSLNRAKGQAALANFREMAKESMTDANGKPFKFEDIDPERFAELKKERMRLQEEGRLRIMFAKGLREELMERYKDPAKIPQYLLETLNFVDSASPAIERSMEYLGSFNDIFDGEENKDPTDQINMFAELMLKHDGRSFVDIVESLMKQEQEKKRVEEIEEGNPELEHYALQSPAELQAPSNEGYADAQADKSQYMEQLGHSHDHEQNSSHDHAHNHNHHEHDHGHGHNHDHDDHGSCEYDDGEYASEYDEEDYDYQHDCEHHHNCGHDCHHECEHDDHYEEDSEQESEEESEYSRQKRIEEVRGFFMIQAVSLIRAKFREAYEKKMSEDRTQKFIEELEAEETAKKEKELKKLKQKEKQKEKKRLQQLEKEEEKKRKEAEELVKATELKRKQDELRAEQLRRKEELRLKKEEEKLRKIEALKKKEQEQKKLNEEKLRLEQEKQKELERKQKEQSEREQKEREQKQREAEERKAAEQERKRNKKKEAAKQTINEPPSTIAERKSIIAEYKPNNGFVSDMSMTSLANNLPIAPEVSNNHILDQLYQARPKSVSGNSHGQLPTTDQIYSPQVQNSFISQEQFGYQQWPTGSNTNLASQNNVFSPFVDQSGAEQWPQNQYVDGFGAQTTAHRPSSSGTTVWGNGYAPRNNSIWNSNTPTAASGSTIWSSPVPQNATATTSILPSLAPETVHDVNLIHAATYDAFCVLQNSNQVSFGLAPAIALFQTTKQLLNNSSMGMADFLNTLRAGGRYQFDFVYDDNGSVTHIKVSALVNVPTPPLVSMRNSLQSSVPPQLLTPLQQHTPTVPPGLQPQFQQQFPAGLQYQKPQETENYKNQAGASSGDQINYDISLPGSVQELLNQLGFGPRGSIW